MKILVNRLVSGVEGGDVLSDDHINAANELLYNQFQIFRPGALFSSSWLEIVFPKLQTGHYAWLVSHT